MAKTKKTAGQTAAPVAAAPSAAAPAAGQPTVSAPAVASVQPAVSVQDGTIANPILVIDPATWAALKLDDGRALPEDLAELSVRELARCLKSLGASPSGLKEELVERLKDLRPADCTKQLRLAKRAALEAQLVALNAETDDKVNATGLTLSSVTGGLSPVLPQQEEKTTTTTTTKDPWLAAAGKITGVNYPADWAPYVGDSRVLLDVWAWPALLINNNLKGAALRSPSGLRTPVAEEFFQLWKQVSRATETEASSLLSLLEEVALCVDARDAKTTSTTFFAMHKARFERGRNLCLTIESRMLKEVDPLVARQVAKRAAINQLPLSIGALEFAAKARLYLPKGKGDGNGGGGGDGATERACRYCKEPVAGSFFKHLKTCKSKPPKK